jgi:hypothetical protein
LARVVENISAFSSRFASSPPRDDADHEGRRTGASISVPVRALQSLGRVARTRLPNAVVAGRSGEEL